METKVLTGRKAVILKTIIADYIATGQAVASASVARRPEVGVSPATVRNEMADLEQEGYITHAHSSGGRIPRDKGYRYFVDGLMEKAEPTPMEQKAIRHQFRQIMGEVEEWPHLASTILSRAASNAALATLPECQEVRLKRLELVAWQDLLALLILVLQEAKLKHQVLTLPQPATQDDLTMVANRLNWQMAGHTCSEIRAGLTDLTPLEQHVAGATIKMMEGPEQGRREVRWEGLGNMLRQPEFSNTRRAQEVLEVMEEPMTWQELISQVLQDEGVQVFIGVENRQEALRQCSLVLARYGKPGRGLGALGILGPTRMWYDQAVGAVQYLASVMNDLVEELGL